MEVDEVKGSDRPGPYPTSPSGWERGDVGSQKRKRGSRTVEVPKDSHEKCKDQEGQVVRVGVFRVVRKRNFSKMTQLLTRTL